MECRVADNYIKPFKDSVIRFDFEVPEEDEHLVGVLPMLGAMIGSVSK